MLRVVLSEDKVRFYSYELFKFSCIVCRMFSFYRNVIHLYHKMYVAVHFKDKLYVHFLLCHMMHGDLNKVCAHFIIVIRCVFVLTSSSLP